jgi:hypothetical protein
VTEREARGRRSPGVRGRAGAWPAVTYVSYRIPVQALPDGVPAAVGAAVLATALEAVTEQNAVAEDVWSYPDHPLSSLRVAGAPCWNLSGLLTVVFVTAMLPTLAGWFA